MNNNLFIETDGLHIVPVTEDWVLISISNYTKHNNIVNLLTNGIYALEKKINKIHSVMMKRDKP